MKNGLHFEVVGWIQKLIPYSNLEKEIGFCKPPQVSGYFCVKQSVFLWIVTDHVTCPYAIEFGLNCNQNPGPWYVLIHISKSKKYFSKYLILFLFGKGTYVDRFLNLITILQNFYMPDKDSIYFLRTQIFSYMNGKILYFCIFHETQDEAISTLINHLHQFI